MQVRHGDQPADRAARQAAGGDAGGARQEEGPRDRHSHLDRYKHLSESINLKTCNICVDIVDRREPGEALPELRPNLQHRAAEAPLQTLRQRHVSGGRHPS